MPDMNDREGVPYYYPEDYSPTEWMTWEEYEKWRKPIMPTKGKCMSCGEEHYLTGLLVQHKEDKHWEFWMVCETCRKWYESQKEEHDEVE